MSLNERPWQITAVTIVLVIFTLVTAGCAISDLKDYGDRVVKAGLTVDKMKGTHGSDPRVWDNPAYRLANGNVVYVDPVGYGAGYKNCDFHWEVNPEGRVVGYKTIGDRCW